MSAGRQRRIRILAHFRTTGRATAKKLAEVMQVTKRTIYKDIAELMDYGLPIEGKAGDGYVWRGERTK
jgi:predicted DNA-binding transcriptional regulator YafY